MRASFLDISSLAPSTVDALLKSIDFLDRDSSESTTSEVDGEFTEQTISSLMWSLGTLRLDFRRLLHRRQIVHTSVLANNTSSSHLEKLMDCVSSVSNQLSLQGVFNVLHGAANMNMMRSTFSSKVWSELEEAIVRTTKEFLGPDTKWSFSADIAVSNIIWSCGKLGATRTSAATQQLLDVFLMRGLAMGHLAVSSSMHGFTKVAEDLF